jgi:hypothetical protein
VPLLLTILFLLIFIPQERYNFPYDVEPTDLRCDGYIISASQKVCFVVELTVPMEDNIEYWHQVKTEKYNKAFAGVVDWKIHHVVVEVGCRGWIPGRFSSLMRKLGLIQKKLERCWMIFNYWSGNVATSFGSTDLTRISIHFD